jgi:hypothetical protein
LSGEQTERGDRNRGGKAQVAWTPHFQQETRFEIVLILQDSDGAGFSGFGCAERVVLVVVMIAIISDVWEMRFAGRAWAVPETRFGLGLWLSRFEQLMRT